MSNSIIMSIVPKIWSFSLHDQQVLWVGVFFFISLFEVSQHIGYFKQIFKTLLRGLGTPRPFQPLPPLGWSKSPSLSFFLEGFPNCLILPSFNFNLFGSWVSFNFTFSAHPPDRKSKVLGKRKTNQNIPNYGIWFIKLRLNFISYINSLSDNNCYLPFITRYLIPNTCIWHICSLTFVTWCLLPENFWAERKLMHL